jgi:hypothetical protein
MGLLSRSNCTSRSILSFSKTYSSLSKWVLKPDLSLTISPLEIESSDVVTRSSDP